MSTIEHTLPLFAGYETVDGAVAEELFTDGLCLPSGHRHEPSRMVELNGWGVGAGGGGGAAGLAE